MFVGTGRPRKPEERAEARRLRREGMSIKRIAARVGVSPSSVLYWTRDIELTPEQDLRNLQYPPGAEVTARRAESCRRTWRERRAQWQEEGRRRASEGDPLHLAGCMLYWAEGAKGRNGVVLCNSDVHMVAFFKRFLMECFGVTPEGFGLRLHVYLGNGLALLTIENRWLGALDLPRSCLRKHHINPLPTSSSGQKKNKLPYGVATLRVNDTRITQHIFGAIQEYGGFDEPRWLDGPAKKAGPTARPTSARS
jgi:AcrR family transcriptional regulator